MKKLLFSLFFILFTGLFTVFAESYTIDDSRLDQLFSSSATISVTDLGTTASGIAVFSGSAIASSKDPLVAILLDIFVGVLGVHRFYLGTEPLTGIGYILTCGGIFGIVPLIDLIVLAINYEDISPYVDNPKFFMW